MKLDPLVAEEVSEALGHPLPHPEDDAFDELLLRLDEQNPELADRLRGGLIPSGGGDLELQARRTNARAAARRKLARALFQRHDDIEHEWYVSKSKLLFWSSLAGLGTMALLFWSAPLLGGPEEPPLQDRLTGELVPGGGDETVPTLVQEDDPFSGVSGEVAQDGRAQGALAGARPIPRTAAPASTPGTEEPTGEPEADPSPATGSDAAGDIDWLAQPAEATPAETPSYEDPVLPNTEGETDPGLLAYSQGAPEDAARGLRASGAGAPAPGAPSGDPFAEGGDGGTPDGGPVGLAAYRRAEPREEVERALLAFAAPPEELLPPRVFGRPAQAVPEARLVSGAPAEPDPYAAAERAPAAAPRAVPAPRADPYAAGDTLPARLSVGVVAMGSTPLPVLARATDGSVWQGTASLTPTGRVDLRFDRVIVGRSAHAVYAVGRAPDGYLGLPAAVSETTPALASDLSRGALRGLSEYVQALGAETDVRLEGGVPVLSRNAPPLEASVAGSVARLFTPPEGEGQRALVRLARVPAGARVAVVVLDGPPAAEP